MIVLYSLLRPFSQIALNTFYRINVKGKERVPDNTPIIFAPSHSNGFIDPVILGMQFYRRVRFFARGDVFKGKFAKFMLNQMNTSPMYRMQEGYAEIKKNDKSFEECKTRLSKNEIILIYPEGIANHERRLFPLKKGLSRIALQTLESLNYEKDILVVPIAMNYVAQTRFRSKVFIEVGEPISVKSFETKYKLDKVRTINEFTKNLEEKLLGYVHHINNPDNDQLVADIEEVYTVQLLKEKELNVKMLVNQAVATGEIIKMVNVLDVNKPELVSSLKTKLRNYIELLTQNQLRDHLLREESINKMNFGTFILEYLIIYLGMPIYLIGLLLNFPPYYLAKNLADKKIKKAEFYASFRANLSMIFWTVYFLIQVVILLLLFKSWWLLVLHTCVVAFTGFFVIKYYSVMKKIFGRWRLLRMVRKDKKTVEQLVNERSAIMTMLENAYLEYSALKIDESK